LPEFKYTVTEHDPEKPWLVRGRRHGTVKLEDDASFFEWAAEGWPAPRWSVELDPGRLAPWLRGSVVGRRHWRLEPPTAAATRERERRLLHV